MYDITVSPLVKAWGFGYEGKNFPDSACIDSLRDLVGMEKLALKEWQLFKQLPGMQLDASSIAKGLGVDLVAECLENHGVRDYMVEIGGGIRLGGQYAAGRCVLFTSDGAAEERGGGVWVCRQREKKTG